LAFISLVFFFGLGCDAASACLLYRVVRCYIIYSGAKACFVVVVVVDSSNRSGACRAREKGIERLLQENVEQAEGSTCVQSHVLAHTSDDSVGQHRAAAMLAGIELPGNLIWASLEEKGIRADLFLQGGRLKQESSRPLGESSDYFLQLIKAIYASAGHWVHLKGRAHL
jgi:hypothetical protein